MYEGSNVTGGALAATFYSLDKDTKPWTSDYVDICSVFDCPIEAGFRDFEIRGVLRADLPKVLPSACSSPLNRFSQGKYIAKFQSIDDYGRALGCAVFVVEVDAHAKKSHRRDAHDEVSSANPLFLKT